MSEPTVFCVLCGWTATIGAQAHATLIHPDEPVAVLPQMDREFIVRVAARPSGEVDVARAAIEHVIGMLDTDRDRELVRIALTRPRRILPTGHPAALAAAQQREGAVLDNFDTHPFDDAAAQQREGAG